MSHEVRTVLGYHGNELGRYQELLGYAYGPEVFYQQIANPNIWRLLNIRYFLTDSPEAPIPGTQLVAGPARNAAGTMSYLYRMPGDNPFAWVAPVIVKAADDGVLATLRDPRFDVHSAALFDTAAAVQGADPTTPPASLDLPVEVVRYAPGAIDLRLSAPAPAGAALVASENFYPGWRATVDGREAPVGRADFVLIGVPLPEGAREVSLRFESAPYERGRLVTLLSLALAAALVGWGLFAERARRG
jgi:hypothetical protein